MQVSIRPLRLPLAEFAPLRDDASREGAAFIERLVAKWEQGANRFDRPGERLLGAFAGESLVGVGGLSRDPYRSDEGVGRLRHLYVLAACRGRGVGSMLVDRLLAGSDRHFARIRLRTRDAGSFYLRHGFQETAEPNATHVRRLQPAQG